MKRYVGGNLEKAGVGCGGIGRAPSRVIAARDEEGTRCQLSVEGTLLYTRLVQDRGLGCAVLARRQRRAISDRQGQWAAEAGVFAGPA